MIARRLRLGAAIAPLRGAMAIFPLNTDSVVSSTLPIDCLEYRVVGICYWLFCTKFGWSVRTYVPDAVMSSYSNPRH